MWYGDREEGIEKEGMGVKGGKEQKEGLQLGVEFQDSYHYVPAWYSPHSISSIQSNDRIILSLVFFSSYY